MAIAVTLTWSAASPIIPLIPLVTHSVGKQVGNDDCWGGRACHLATAKGTSLWDNLHSLLHFNLLLLCCAAVAAVFGDRHRHTAQHSIGQQGASYHHSVYTVHVHKAVRWVSS
jgi:hypothetical protein